MSAENQTVQQKILNEYREGASDVEVAAMLGIPKKKFDQMYEEIDDFARVIDMGRTLSQAWWVKAGRKYILDRNFQTTMWSFNMKNRYGWADKVDMGERESTMPEDIDAARTELDRALKSIAKTNPELVQNAIFGEGAK